METKMAKGFHKFEGMSEESSLLMQMTLFGGDPRVGYATNPETRNHPGFIEKNEEKIVCLAKGGECRYNQKFKDWKTPIIDETCPNICCFKNLVCDSHRDCTESFKPYAKYNKFRGQFLKYCRNFDKLKKTQK